MTIAPPPAQGSGIAPPAPRDVAAFLADLSARGFSGEIAADPGTRAVHSTDNSVYRLEPAAVIFPQDAADVERAVLAAAARRGAVPLTPRGGATGTNGQSLTAGVVLDTSRHMRRVLAFDPSGRTITVEPGLVLDGLNEYLRPHGLFFPPTVSTASRATIGGMVATDASGKGSRVYGRTSDYVEALDLVLSDGRPYRAARLAPDELDAACRLPGVSGTAIRETRRVLEANRARIAEVFPAMNRGLTGYNLKDVEQADGGFALPFLLAGSEGTLAVTTAITLRLLPRPRCRALAILGYATFSDALGHVGALLAAEPLAVEILDDKILSIARGDVVWSRIGALLGGESDAAVGGLNVVEFVGDSDAEIANALSRVDGVLAAPGAPPLTLRSTVSDPAAIAAVWDLRKKAVGLLGRLPGRRQGVPFVEDTAVPPERLTAYVAAFRAILDRHGLSYGMFGHADVGCLHVRPALDMESEADRLLIRTISDEVALLTKSHGGLIWGEHGRGVRGEFSPLFFGDDLYAELCRIKTAFDPYDIFNPGKLARPAPGGTPVAIDAVPFRGARDAEVTEEARARVEGALACNGNGACHGIDRFDAMCPSFKATGDRAQSPKGRASLLREWARLDGLRSADDALATDFAAIERAAHESLSTCLACKACAGQCPVRVDVPAMRSRFLQRYHERHSRPARHRLLACLEPLVEIASRLPRPANALLSSRLGTDLLRKRFGLVDLPPLSPRRPDAVLRRRAAADPARPGVVLVQDGFTSRFDADVPLAAVRLLEALGYAVRFAPVMPNGKALHGLGLRRRFAGVAARARARLEALRAEGLPLVSVEAVTALMHAHEYAEDAGPPRPALPGIEAFLADEIKAGRLMPPRLGAGQGDAPYRIFLHCTERSLAPQTAERWKTVFAALGLVVETPPTGCCGMAGLFGHEAEHQDMSRRLFEASWRERLAETSPDRVLATGFSCRCQTERMAGTRPRHPVEALAALLEPQGPSAC